MTATTPPFFNVVAGAARPRVSGPAQTYALRDLDLARFVRGARARGAVDLPDAVRYTADPRAFGALWGVRHVPFHLLQFGVWAGRAPHLAAGLRAAARRLVALREARGLVWTNAHWPDRIFGDVAFDLTHGHAARAVQIASEIPAWCGTEPIVCHELRMAARQLGERS